MTAPEDAGLRREAGAQVVDPALVLLGSVTHGGIDQQAHRDGPLVQPRHQPRPDLGGRDLEQQRRGAGGLE
jgi:hypothetical protein